MAQPLSLDQSQSMRQTQRLIMSPQMQQAIQLLQVPIMELSAMIELEIEQNPILEYSVEEEVSSVEADEEETFEEPDTQEQEMVFDDHDFEIMKQLDEDFRDTFTDEKEMRVSTQDEKLRNFLDNSIRKESSLFEHLLQQAREEFEDPKELELAEAIIGNFDEAGFLQTNLTEIALLLNNQTQDLALILQRIQKFDPCGVGASSLQECLLIQLRAKGRANSLAYKIIETNYDNLLHNHIRIIQKELQCTPEDIAQAVQKDITKLDLQPGTSFSKEIAPPIIPDVIIKQEDENLIVEINDEGFPPLRLNSRYMRMLEDESIPKETKDFIKHKIVSAKWLLRNIYQRNDTIERIAKALTTMQRNFFLSPDGQLTPLTMKTLADELQVHESTIARAVSNKYMDSPRGILPLRTFFTNAYVTEKGQDISSQTVKTAIRDLITNEDKRRPLSDEAISKELKSQGVPCARRTVAKYRLELNLSNAQQRKKFS